MNKLLKTSNLSLYEYARQKKLNYKDLSELSERLNKINQTPCELVNTNDYKEFAKPLIENKELKDQQPEITITTNKSMKANIIEVPIFLDKEVFHKLNELSFIKDTSVSSLVSNIVKDHIKNTMNK